MRIRIYLHRSHLYGAFKGAETSQKQSYDLKSKAKENANTRK